MRKVGFVGMGLTAFSIIIAAVALEVLGQVAFKHGSRRVHARGELGALHYWGAMMRDAWVLLGIALHVVELLLWIAALNLAPLSIAFPITALSYVGVAVAGHYLLGERLGGRSRIAIAMITAGTVLVALPPA